MSGFWKSTRKEFSKGDWVRIDPLGEPPRYGEVWQQCDDPELVEVIVWGGGLSVFLADQLTLAQRPTVGCPAPLLQCQKN